VDADQLLAVTVTSRRFAQREVVPRIGTTGRDGDLIALDEVLQQAEAIGLLATPDAESPGHALGVWGEACLEAGPESSLLILEEVSVACAGVAACLHASGLAVAELSGWRGPYTKVAVACFDSSWRPTWEALQSPPPLALRLEGDGDELTLTGSASSVLAPPGCEAYVVYASRDGRWERVVVPVGAAGLSVTDVGQRSGLAAVGLFDLVFDHVRLPASGGLLSATSPHAYLRRFMLGLAALAVGNATGALHAARRYAQERSQGGDLIERHPAIQLLLGDSGARIATCAAALADVARRDEDDAAAMWRALALKLRATVECQQATSDCLQVLGGYGYMEEYRLEKRLRDAMTLTSMTLAPDALRLLCAESAHQPGGAR